MKDFFSQFRENLISRPEPEFDPQDWQKLEKRLDEPAEKRRLALPFFGWLWLPLGLLLLGSNAAFWFEIRQARLTIEHFENHRDTVFLTKTIYRTDTVFLTRVLRQATFETLPAVFREEGKSASGNSFSTGPLIGFLGKNATDSIAFNADKNRLIAKNEKVTHNFSKDNPVSGETPGEHFLEKKDMVFEKKSDPETSEIQVENPPAANTLAPTPALEQQLQKRESSDEDDDDDDKFLLALRPKSFALLASGGWAVPPVGGRHLGHGWSAGLAGEVGFSKNLRLWADANFQQNRLETSHMDAALGVPPVAPPDDNLKFVLATAPENFWQFSAGMAHAFRPLGGWRPILGVGWGIRLAQAYDLTYDFENDALGVSWKFEREVQPAEKQVQFALLRCGVEREFARHWRLQIGGSVRGDFVSEEGLIPRFSGLQLGFGRRF